MIEVCQHLYQVYPQMPKYAADPSESDFIKSYNHLLLRFQGHYGKQPTFFVKSPAIAYLMGDMHGYSGYGGEIFSSSQNFVVAVAPNNHKQIRVNHYQKALYGELTLSSEHTEWKFTEEPLNNMMVAILRAILKVNQHGLKEFTGMDLLISKDFIEDPFLHYQQAMLSSLLVAIYSCSIGTLGLSKAKISTKSITEAVQVLSKLLNNDLGRFDLHSKVKFNHFYRDFSTEPQQSINRYIPFDSNKYSLVLAYSMTPLPKKLIQGKRFNLRHCEILIGIEIIKSELGFIKDIKSLRELQESLSCSTKELLETVCSVVPEGKMSVEQIETMCEKSLIDILKEVPYANNVINQNLQFFPNSRMQYFLKQQLLLCSLTSETLPQTLLQSHKNAISDLQIGSQQISELISLGSPWSCAYKIIGNGWGGHMLFLCEKGKANSLVDQLINGFYLKEQNKILLSDEIDMCLSNIDMPATGLIVLDPETQIWF